MRPRTLAVLAAAVVLGGVPCAAQTAASRPPRIEAGAAGGLLGGASLGATDANLRRNPTIAGASRTYPLFATTSDLARAPFLEVRAAYAFGARFAAEAGLTWSAADLRTRVTSDVEGAPDVTLSESVDQYVITGGLVIALPELTRSASRLVPFATVGAGYLRQLHEGRTVVEQGEAYYAGGGVKYELVSRPAGAVRGMGLRGDGRVYLLRRGVSFDEGPRPHVAISGGVFVRF